MIDCDAYVWSLINLQVQFMAIMTEYAEVTIKMWIIMVVEFIKIEAILLTIVIV